MSIQFPLEGRQPLLPRADVEGVVGERGIDASSEQVHSMLSSALGHVVPIKTDLKQVGIHLLLISMLGAGVLLVVKSQWQELRSYKAWLLFLCVPPVSYIFRCVGGYLQQTLQRARYLRVEISPHNSHDLFRAVLNFVDTHARGLDVEAITEYDLERRSYIAKLRYLSSRGGSCDVLASVPSHLLHEPVMDNWSDQRHLHIEYSCGRDPIVLGRDQHVERQESLIMWLRRSKVLFDDRLFVTTWLNSCVKLFRQPPDNCIDMYILEESSVDWVPEWKRVLRNKFAMMH